MENRHYFFKEMSLIKNLIKESDNAEKSKDDSKNISDVDNKNQRPIIKSALDLQRLKLEKLMKNPVTFYIC